MPRAVIIAGTGAIGRATTSRLLAAGWDVHVTGRHRHHLPDSQRAAGVGFTVLDRTDTGAGERLATLVGDGADLIVDCGCFTAADAARLLTVAPRATATVMISTKAVYADDEGNHVNGEMPPHFHGPIREDQPTVAPGDGAYDTREGYAANKVAAEQSLLDSGLPISVIRPSKVHGPGARVPREWMFVRRVLDRRAVLVLAHRGAGVDHPSAAANTAALVETVAAYPGTRVLNSADPDTPSALEIARTVAAALGHRWTETLLDDEASDEAGHVGRHLWDARTPIRLDTGAATALGYRPVGTYAETVTDKVAWLVAAAGGGPDAELLPAPDDPVFGPLLDYPAEDAYLSRGPQQR